MKRKFMLMAALFCASTIGWMTTANASDIKDMKTLGIFMNYDIPDGTFSDYTESSFGGGLKFGYGFTKELGMELAFSRFNFDGKSVMGMSGDDFSIDNFRGNILYRFNTTTNLYPFLTAGLGYYMPNDGNSNSDDNNDLGFNLGVGLTTELIDINDMFALEFSGNYHHILNDGDDVTFFELRAGINFNFF